MDELLPCPFCGGEANTLHRPHVIDWRYSVGCNDDECRGFIGLSWLYKTEAEAIAAWNSRAAMEFDNWFYLPKPKEPIVEVTETTHAWDGTKVKTDVFYQVQEQAVINWAKELDEHIIKRICEVWNSRAERTCKQSRLFNLVWSECSSESYEWHGNELPTYCPNCGCKVVNA